MASATEAQVNTILLQVSVEKNAAFHDEGGITLGELRALLGPLDPYIPIKMEWHDRLVNVGDLDSYRGYYEDLAIEPGGPARTTAEVADMLHAANGETFTGYKGGEFTMHEDTPVWVSGYGDASGVGVTGVVSNGRLAVITTAVTDLYG